MDAKTWFALFGKEGYTYVLLEVHFKIGKKNETDSFLFHTTDVSLYDKQVKNTTSVKSDRLMNERDRQGANGAEMRGCSIWNEHQLSYIVKETVDI